MSLYRESQMNWKFVKELGSGAFGKVSLWINTETGQSVAIKRCSIDVDKLALDEQSKLKTRWQQESAWLKDIHIENIVRSCPDLCENLMAMQNQEVKLPVIAMEYCDGGNLRSKLHQIEHVNGFSEHDVRQVLIALRRAVFHLHDLYKITHRDIKPDNIVIKYNAEGTPIYKLTDMGYARILDKETILGSMVGSKYYFAPEIVESAQYKNSVDYWSMGVVAFEIMCGIYPFLQESSMFEILTSIKDKPPGCIAITKSNNGKLWHHSSLFPENRLSKAFRRAIEPWLQLALEADCRKRGYETPDGVPTLTFFTKLDDTLHVKILTVFWLNRCKFLSYSVYKNTTMDNLCSSIEKDIGISRKEFYFVVPSGHTLHQLTPESQPLQLHEDKFSIEGKPMLYLVDFGASGLCNPEDPFVSSNIRLIFGSKKKLHQRILNECVYSALYLHYYELRRVIECASGIHEFAMNLESEAMKEEKSMKTFQEKMMHVNGQITHYETTVILGKRLLKEKKIANFESICNAWKVNAQNLNNLNAEYLNAHRRLKSILKRIRALMKQSPLSEYQEEVTFQVKQFQTFFEEFRDRGRSISTEEIRSHISSLLRVRKDFYENTNKWLQKNGTAKRITEPVDVIIEIRLEFHTIMKIVFEKHSLWRNYEMNVTEKTKEFMQIFGDMFYNQGRMIAHLSRNIGMLDVDSYLFTSVVCHNTDSLFDVQTDDLIKNTQHLSQALESCTFGIPNDSMLYGCFVYPHPASLQTTT